jgi:hypothetical protein
MEIHRSVGLIRQILLMLNFFKNTGLGVLVQACNPRTGEAEAEEF